MSKDKQIFTPKQPLPLASQALVGDIFEAPMGRNQLVPGGVQPPDYGDIMQLQPGELGYGDVIALRELGDTMSKTAAAVPSFAKPIIDRMPVEVVGTRSKGEFAPSKTPELQAVNGIVTARTDLSRIGIVSRSAQDATIDTAVTAARMVELGRRSLGKYGPNDNLPFVFCQNGLLHSVQGLREGAGAKVSLVKQLMFNQIATRPFKNYISSTIPPAGGTVNLTTLFPPDELFELLFFVVIVSNSVLQNNQGKVYQLAPRPGTGGTPGTPYYTAQFSTGGGGMAGMIMLPSREVDGNYYPQTVKVNNNTVVPANSQDIYFTISGNDGVNDSLTVIAVGNDDWYYKTIEQRML